MNLDAFSGLVVAYCVASGKPDKQKHNRRWRRRKARKEATRGVSKIASVLPLFAQLRGFTLACIMRSMALSADLVGEVSDAPYRGKSQ
jgi:hypothetical protein